MAGSGAQGGAPTNSSGGGGGNGYYGGGSGATAGIGNSGGGGGGSSYAGAGTSAVMHTQGYRNGNGYVRLRNAEVPAPVLDGSNFVNVVGDNLGTHTATQDLNLGTNRLTGTGRVNIGNDLNLGGNQLVGNGSVSVGNNLNPGTNQLVGNGGSQGLSVAGTGAVTLAAGLSLPIRTLNQVAGSYPTVTLTDADYTVRSGSPQGVGGAAVFSFVLPDAAGRTGRVYVLLNYGNTPANLLTTTPGSGNVNSLVYDDASGSVTQVPRAS